MQVGVYLNQHRNTAIVVKVAGQKCAYLTIMSGRITVERSGTERFETDWPIHLSDYDVMAAIKKYSKSGLYASDEAVELIKQIYAAQKARKAATTTKPRSK